MKDVLRMGKISILLPEGNGGGLSGEVHLLEHNRKRYVIRRCKELKKAKQYEFLSKKLERYGFLPKFLGRFGRDVLYEYIEGRDLKKTERIKIFYQLGKIEAHINGLPYTKGMRFNKNPEKMFLRQLKEITTGKYKPSDKIEMRRMKDRGMKFDKRKIKAIISIREEKQIKDIYSLLKDKTKPKVVFDVKDLVYSNFRIRNSKVYLVDIEAIKPHIRGFGIAKCFLMWAKTEKRQKEFLKGYAIVGSLKFFNKKYKDLCYLMFIIQALNYKAQVGRNYSGDLKVLKKMLREYKNLK